MVLFSVLLEIHVHLIKNPFHLLLAQFIDPPHIPLPEVVYLLRTEWASSSPLLEHADFSV
jgi:hypothetical protein